MAWTLLVREFLGWLERQGQSHITPAVLVGLVADTLRSLNAVHYAIGAVSTLESFAREKAPIVDLLIQR